MSNGTESVPPQSGGGCLGKGCTTVLGLGAFLVIALIAGTFWGIHYLRGFSSPEPLPLPIAENTPAVVDTYVPPAATQPAPLPTAAPVTAAPQPEATPALPVPTPTPNVVSATPLVGDWKSFQRAAKRGQAVRIELTDADINGLIAGSDDARGKVWVSINNDVGRVQVSMPLEGVPTMSGRYLNGELTVQSSPDGDPAKVRVSNILLNGQPVSNAFLDRSLFGYPSLRTVVGQWVTQQRIGTFRIENNRAIGESSGSR